MGSTTFADIQPAMDRFKERIRQFKKDHPECFEPFQLIVVKDDGTEVNLCDISRPLGELMAEAEKNEKSN